HAVLAARDFVERQFKRDKLYLSQRGLGLEVDGFGRALYVDVVVPHHLGAAEGRLELARDELDSDLIASGVEPDKCAFKRKRFAFERIGQGLIRGDGIGEDAGGELEAPIEVFVEDSVEREARSDADAAASGRFGRSVEALIVEGLGPEADVAAEPD